MKSLLLLLCLGFCTQTFGQSTSEKDLKEFIEVFPTVNNMTSDKIANKNRASHERNNIYMVAKESSKFKWTRSTEVLWGEKHTFDHLSYRTNKKVYSFQFGTLTEDYSISVKLYDDSTKGFTKYKKMKGKNDSLPSKILEFLKTPTSRLSQM